MISFRDLIDDGDNETEYTHPDGALRPRTRGECSEVVRPCPYVSCRYNLFIDVTRDGSVVLNPIPINGYSCALDVADDYKDLTMEDVSDLLNTEMQEVKSLTFNAARVVRRFFNKGDFVDEE